jgi:hypothetical protein
VEISNQTEIALVEEPISNDHALSYGAEKRSIFIPIEVIRLAYDVDVKKRQN